MEKGYNMVKFQSSMTVLFSYRLILKFACYFIISTIMFGPDYVRMHICLYIIPNTLENHLKKLDVLWHKVTLST